MYGNEFLERFEIEWAIAKHVSAVSDHVWRLEELHARPAPARGSCVTGVALVAAAPHAARAAGLNDLSPRPRCRSGGWCGGSCIF